MIQFPTSRNRGGYNLSTRPESQISVGLLDSHVDGELTAHVGAAIEPHRRFAANRLGSAAYHFFDLVFGFHEFRQGIRFTISESARREVLQRLLKLNHKRYAEEVRQGLHGKKGGAGRVASGGKKAAAGGKAAAKKADATGGKKRPSLFGEETDE